MKTRVLIFLVCCSISALVNATYFDYNGLSFQTWYDSGGDAVAYCNGLSTDNPNPVSIVVPNTVIFTYTTTGSNGATITHSAPLTVQTAEISGSENTQSIYISDGIYGASGISGPSLTSVYLGCEGFSYGFNGCPNLTHITVGPYYKRHNGQTTCFYGTTNLKEITWNAISAEQGRFDGGSTITAGVLQNLETLTFGDQVEYIPPEIANNAVKLNHVTIPSSVTAIGDGAFYNSGLSEIYIPNSVVSLGNNVFSGCGNLTSAVMENSVVSLGTSVFKGCSSLNDVKLSESLTSINKETFYQCSSLKTIVMPKMVNNIGHSAFSKCDGLELVYLPDSLKHVDSYAFYNCTHLAHVYSPIKEPQNVSFNPSNPFVNSSCVVHVPKGTLALYQALSPWNQYVLVDDYEQCVSTLGDVNCDGAVTSSDVTSLYNYLLNGDGTYLATGDVDGDGSITSADITAVYNILLGNQ